VRGVVGADPSDDLRPVADRLDNRPQQAIFLLIGGGRRLAGRAADDKAVVAVVNQVGGQLCGAVDVERTVRGERGDHGREYPTNGRVSLCGSLPDMTRTLPRALIGPAGDRREAEPRAGIKEPRDAPVGGPERHGATH